MPGELCREMRRKMEEKLREKLNRKPSQEPNEKLAAKPNSKPHKTPDPTLPGHPAEAPKPALLLRTADRLPRPRQPALYRRVETALDEPLLRTLPPPSSSIPRKRKRPALPGGW